ncbi:hypothetical protein MNBD_GAMMA23-1282 [hydrothermal vent metagenome]|uniref:PEP-CTERM protein-sorting domain-containing protein n=1 Tax=hydrothermal vent metagenome TaxID=652676 RepID=A0A3B1AT22_9ZZZZ
MKILPVILFLASFASGAQAAVLQTYTTGTATPTTLGGYDMTDFALTGASGTTTSILSPLSGSLSFINRYGNASPMVINQADSVSWWNNGEAFNYDVFLTGESLITILLPENTRAFSFNVGADLGSTGLNAWLNVGESTGAGLGNTMFNVNRNNTPGFGVYADNSNGGCSALTSVTIDPIYWGFGNFSINQSNCVIDVPEVSSLYLFGLGLLGLLVVARRKV